MIYVIQALYMVLCIAIGVVLSELRREWRTHRLIITRVRQIAS